MGTGASIKENIRFDQLEVTETLHDFLEDEKSKSHEAVDIHITDCKKEVIRLRKILHEQILNHRLSKYNAEYALHEAIDNRNLEDLILFLKHDKQIRLNINVYRARYDESDFCRITPLYSACEQGLTNFVKILCQYADTNLGRKFDNATPLFGAACNGHLDVVKELILNNDVNIDQPNTQNISPLSAAVGNNHYKVVRFLIHNGASLDETCIFIASHSNSIESLQEILKPMVILDVINKLICTTIETYLFEQINNDIEVLHDENMHVSYNVDDNTVFVTNNKKENKKLMIENPTRKTKNTIKLGTSLWQSKSEASFFQLDLQINTLLNHDHSTDISTLINRKTKFGWNALHIAAYKGNLEVLKILLENGGKYVVNEPTSIDGKTPLYIANENKKIKVVNYLKSESIDAFKYTNIFDAAKNGNNKEIGKFLKHNLADINEIDAFDSNNSTPLTYACRYGHLACVQYILSKGGNKKYLLANRRTPLFEAIHNNHTAIAKYLWRMGCNINRCDKFKIRPIILAAKRDHVKGVNLCLKCGALEEVCDDQGRSAFFYACMNGNEEIFNLLYDSKRIDMERPDHSGVTPLMIACSNGHLNIIRLLLIHLNCYIDCISKAGYLAVDYAMQNKPQVRNSVIAIFELRNHKRSIIELWKRIYLSILRVLELESITHRKILTRRQWKKPLKVKEKKKYVPRN